jgi:hypothetical protein
MYLIPVDSPKNSCHFVEVIHLFHPIVVADCELLVLWRRLDLKVDAEGSGQAVRSEGNSNENCGTSDV